MSWAHKIQFGSALFVYESRLLSFCYQRKRIKMLHRLLVKGQWRLSAVFVKANYSPTELLLEILGALATESFSFC